MNATDLLAKLERVRGGDGSWTARCPAHDDHDPSLHVTAKPDRVLVWCGAGCSIESICAALGISKRDLFSENGTHAPEPGLTVHSFAKAKALPVEFLKACGLETRARDGYPNAVTFPYRDESGKTVAVRWRSTRNGGRPSFWWPKGAELLPYGLDRLAKAKTKGVLLVEGESDALTAWHCGLLAVGIPGASNWKAEWAAYFEGRRVYVWREPDSGGRRFAASIVKDTPGALVVAPPADIKDVSALWLADPDNFTDRLKAIVTAAKPLDPAEAAEPETEEDAAGTSAGVVVRLDTVTPRRVEWLRPSVWPIGKLSLIVGDPDLGKSLLLVDSAARITSGGEWPEGGSVGPAPVVLLTAEDSLDDTVVPRLIAAGGARERAFALSAVRTGDVERPVSLELDLPILDKLVMETGAVAVFIDPLSAYLGNNTDSHTDADVRGLLHPLAKLADARRLAIVGQLHLNKASQMKALYRVGGSIAFIAAPRSVFTVVQDGESKTRRIFAALKLNLARKPPARAFEIVGDDAPRLEWDPTPVENADVEALLRGPGERETDESRNARDDAKEFLEELLAVGPVPAGDVPDAAKAAGIPWRTVERAKADLGIRSRKTGFEGAWEWHPPSKTATTPIDTHDVAVFEGSKVGSQETATGSPKTATSERDKGKWRSSEGDGYEEVAL